MKRSYPIRPCQVKLADNYREIPHLALKDVDLGSFLLLVLRQIAFFPHGLAAHLYAVGIVHQTVEDAVSDGGIADLLVPARDWCASWACGPRSCSSSDLLRCWFIGRRAGDACGRRAESTLSS